MEYYSDVEYSDSESENGCDYNTCCINKSNECGKLPFDPSSLENLILFISDKFNFRIMVNEAKVKQSLIITTGLTVAGSVIGKHYGGKVGAAVGGAVGSAFGLGIVAISMKDAWQDIKGQLSDLFDLVYDYLGGLGIQDYVRAAKFLSTDGNSTELAMLILHVASDILGKKILSSLTAV